MKPVTEKLVWDRFCQAVDFKRQIGLYDTVRTNENYFIGNQWEGVQAKGLPTPVFNFLKRVVLFQVATITSDNMTLQAAPLLPTAQFPARRLEEITGVLNGQFAALFESAKLTTRLREMMRNSAVDGDGCMYFCFDPDVENGQPVKGEIQAEVVENTRVHFGNPNQRDPQKQPWIILSRRMLLEDARALAERWGADPEALRPDQEAFHNRYDSYTGDKVTVLTHFWRDRTTGSIFCCESAERGMLRPPYDTGLRRYPLIWLSWDFVQDCYHGQSLITGLIPNQNFINKIFALTGVSLLTTAFPKVIYDKNRLRSWDGSVGTAVAVAGGVDGVAQVMAPAAVNPQIAQFMELCMDKTQSFLGASEVALGEGRPENTSAILALQRAANTPMETTKQNLYQAVEDMGRIFLDMMAARYGSRWVQAPLGRQPDTHRSQPLHRREGGTVLHRGGELGSRAGPGSGRDGDPVCPGGSRHPGAAGYLPVPLRRHAWGRHRRRRVSKQLPGCLQCQRVCPAAHAVGGADWSPARYGRALGPQSLRNPRTDRCVPDPLLREHSEGRIAF